MRVADGLSEKELRQQTVSRQLARHHRNHPAWVQAEPKRVARARSTTLLRPADEHRPFGLARRYCAGRAAWTSRSGGWPDGDLHDASARPSRGSMRGRTGRRAHRRSRVREQSCVSRRPRPSAVQTGTTSTSANRRRAHLTQRRRSSSEPWNRRLPNWRDRSRRPVASGPAGPPPRRDRRRCRDAVR